MPGIVKRTVTLAQTVRLAFHGIDRHRRLQLAVVLGIAGLLIFGFAVYNTVDLTNKYNDLDSIPTPDAETVKQMSQAELMTVAQVGIAKRDLLTRRAQASSLMGIGAALLGVAVLVFVSLPEPPRDSTQTQPPAASNANADSENTVEKTAEGRLT